MLMSGWKFLPLSLCYVTMEPRGHGSKKLFYWFYPTHIYVLYALSFLLYLTLYGMGS